MTILETENVVKLENLWPEDFGLLEVVPPVTILRQQATLLGQRTQNILEGLVETVEDKDEFRHSLFIRATALGRYRYRLLRLEHRFFQMYPVVVVLLADVEKGTKSWEANNEHELKVSLKEALASSEARTVIRSLLAQSLATAKP